MKKYGYVVFFLFLGLSGRFQAAAQVQPDSTLMEKYLLDFVVPDMPAFKALGTDPSNLLRPSDVKKFAAMLTPFYSNNMGVIPKNFAAEFAPWKIASRNWTLNDYATSNIKRFLYRSSFSLGTINDTTKFPAKLAIGYRVSFLSKRADIYRAAQVRNDFFDVGAKVGQADFMKAYVELSNYWVLNIAKPVDDVNAYARTHIYEFNKFLVDLEKKPAAQSDSTLVRKHKMFTDARAKTDSVFADLANYWRYITVSPTQDSVPCCNECPDEFNNFVAKVNDYLRIYPDTTLAKKSKAFMDIKNESEFALEDLTGYWARRALKSNSVVYLKEHLDDFKSFIVGINKYLSQHPDLKLTALHDTLIAKYNAINPKKAFSNEELKDLIAAFGKRVDDYLEQYKRDNWNASRFDLALALAAQSPDTLISHAQFALFSFWATWALRWGPNGQVLLGGNFTLPRTNRNLTEAVNQDTRASFNINFRYYLGRQDFRGFFETQYKYKNYDVANKSLLLNLGAEFRMGNMFWVVASAGLDNYLSESNPLNKFVSSLDLRYFFNRPR